MAAFICFLTDFGLQDDFVGTCHGVIKRIAPEAQIIDVTHGLEPGRVLQGALVLANTLPYVPAGVQLAELGPPVDPAALVRLDLPEPELDASRIRVTVLYVDRFGNVAVNVTRAQLETAEIVPGTQVELELHGDRYHAVAARTFADARPGA